MHSTRAVLKMQRVNSFVKALLFLHYVVGFEIYDVVSSTRLKGVAQMRLLATPLRCRAYSWTKRAVESVEHLLCNRALPPMLMMLAGCFLVAVQLRMRFSALVNCVRREAEGPACDGASLTPSVRRQTQLLRVSARLDPLSPHG